MMKRKIEKTLSRAEVNSRIASLEVDVWKDLHGIIDGCSVNAWATGTHRRISRISVCGIQGKSDVVAAFRLAKRIKDLTGLIVHFHSGPLSKTL